MTSRDFDMYLHDVNTRATLLCEACQHSAEFLPRYGRGEGGEVTLASLQPAAAINPACAYRRTHACLMPFARRLAFFATAHLSINVAIKYGTGKASSRPTKVGSHHPYLT